MEYDAFSVNHSHRLARFVEALDLLPQLWRDDEVSFKGEFFSVPTAGIVTKPVNAGGSELWIAANEDDAVRRRRPAGIRG